MKTLDCRGLECPLPVVKTKEALKEELQVGSVTNMYDIVERMEKADKIIKP